MEILIFVAGVVAGVIGTIVYGGYLLTRKMDRHQWIEKYWDDEEGK